jgi:hypothetical protein
MPYKIKNCYIMKVMQPIENREEHEERGRQRQRSKREERKRRESRRRVEEEKKRGVGVEERVE